MALRAASTDCESEASNLASDVTTLRCRSSGRLVERFECVAVALVDVAAANLERRREQLIFEGEIFGQDVVVFHSLIAGKLGVGQGNALIKEAAERWVAVDLNDVTVRYFVVSGPSGDGLGIECDERDEIGLAVAVDGHLRDARHVFEGVLNGLRRDVLTSSSGDEVFLAVYDAQEAVSIKGADIARVEPTVGVERLGGGLGIVDIADEDARATRQNLTILRDAVILK